uniref:NADP-dependent oxidoreductase domain-containing protein n=1 Tax=Tetraselmis chuii TaxID=63592 RepID=A0A6U1LWV5_9CHLO|mmetsp:Transcript_9668/g.17405  ORF Transcript_9668/g.17405 Transcript_9668/m.17405 type:complete len:378 (+) Transcript_9668:152-1285(+)
MATTLSLRTLSAPNIAVRSPTDRRPRRSFAKRGPVRAEATESDGTSGVLAPSAGDMVKLGKSDLEVSALGVGAWSWGDRSGYWGYGNGYDKTDTLKAYQATIDAGINFIDTAEVYGFGLSEEFLGEYMKETGTSPVVATKFAPLPWRFSADSVVCAAKDSLKRLQLEKMGLYMIHWPGFGLNGFANDAYVEGLAQCKQQGLCEAVGVSNFNAERLAKAADKLETRGMVLASNQVQYSLMYRAPETNGVLGVCKEKGITLVAYSPLAQGILTGKYSLSNRPSGPRNATFTDQRLRSVEPLLSLLKDIGSAHSDKTASQVALNWNICKGTVPIPGVKNVDQLAEAAGALGWRMTEEEVAALDEASARVLPFMGAPFENW